MRALVGCLVLLVGWSSAPRGVVGAEADKKMAPPPSNAGNWLQRLGRVRLPDENERSHLTVRKVFRDVVAPASRATVRVLSDGLQTAMGVVVRSDGYVVTKASELRGRLECVLPDGQRIPATAVSRSEQLDLALLQVPAANLSVIQWSEGPAPFVGSWLATPGIADEPTAIGVLSVDPREIPAPRPVLGLGELARADRGVRIRHVVPGTGADRAGLKPGDVIASINGQAAQTPASLTDLIRRLQPGDKVTLAVLRESEALSVTAILGDATRLGHQEQAELMDSLGGPLSKRRAGFPSVLQHDSVLRPRDCGGPLVDLDGKVVGLNIARASRVASYALPASLVRSAVDELLSRAPESPAAVAGEGNASPEMTPVTTNR